MRREATPAVVPDVVGLVPAAGWARRLGPQPRSKEILPIGSDADGRERVACEPLLEALRRGGVGRAFVLLRRGKTDVAELLGSGARHGLDLAYRFLDPTPSVPATLAAAAPFLGEARVALGFPDILFAPADAYACLLDRQSATGADLVLGLFPTDRPEKTDMVELDAAGRVRRLVIKQPDRGLRYTWSIAVWSPPFTRHLVAAAAAPSVASGELWVGDVVTSALAAGLGVEAVTFPGGSYRDLGTPEDLAAVRASADDAGPL